MGCKWAVIKWQVEREPDGSVRVHATYTGTQNETAGDVTSYPTLTAALERLAQIASYHEQTLTDVSFVLGGAE